MWLLTFATPAMPCSPESDRVELAWPAAALPVDAGLLLFHRSGRTVELTDPAGLTVPATVLDLADRYSLVRPDEPLPEGELLVAVGDETWTVTVTGAPLDAVGPPSTLWRELATSLDYRGSACGGPEEFSVDLVRYRVCGEAVLYVAATGVVPPSDDVAEVELLAASEQDTFDFADALGAGEGFTGTVWLGAMDGAGRVAWAEGDTFTMPEDDHLAVVEAIGADLGGATTTPSTPACTAFEGWGPEELARCPTRDGSPDCRPVSGCSTSGASGSGLLALLGVLVGRRRLTTTGRGR